MAVLTLKGSGFAFWKNPKNLVLWAVVHVANQCANLANALKTLTNQLQYNALYNAYGSNPVFVINSNFNVKNTNAFNVAINGALNNIAANTSWSTGTSQVIATNGKWSAALLSINASAAAVLTWSATLNAASEGAAISALPALPDATSVAVGYVTVQSSTAGGGHTWTAGTDALTTGAGGNPANATNYYQNVNPNGSVIGVAVATSAADTMVARVGGTP